MRCAAIRDMHGCISGVLVCDANVTARAIKATRIRHILRGGVRRGAQHVYRRKDCACFGDPFAYRSARVVRAGLYDDKLDCRLVPIQPQQFHQTACIADQLQVVPNFDEAETEFEIGDVQPFDGRIVCPRIRRARHAPNDAVDGDRLFAHRHDVLPAAQREVVDVDGIPHLVCDDALIRR